MPATERLEHPLVAPEFLERRAYQLQLADAASSEHTLVCLPTGLGKTTVSLLVTARTLADHDEGKSVLLAPTKPLVRQHAEFYREALTVPDREIVVFTGEVSPEDRTELWEEARIVIGTPQVIENDLIGSRISLDSVVHLTFDECHRATGEYAYNYIADRYHADALDPLVTGMSASPGGTQEEILTVANNLGLRSAEVMTESDADVSTYTHRTEVEWERIELPEAVLEIRDALVAVIEERLSQLRELGVTQTSDPQLSQSDLNSIRGKLQRLIDSDKSEGYKGMSAHAEIMKLRRAVELVETQSVESVRRYFERQREAARSSSASKATQRFVSEPRVKGAMDRVENFEKLHPKFRRARILLAETLGIEDGERVIVFTESRDTAETLTEFLSNHFSTRKFVGQNDTEGSEGMTQTEQQETLDAFRAGEFDVLVSTSVAEEGLDVPEVDLVLFYEPVPKGIRSIQRKGRTGRGRDGHVVVLLAEDTRDEAFFWISRREEKRMEKELRSLKTIVGEVNHELQTTIEGATNASTATNGGTESEQSERPDHTDQSGLESFISSASKTGDAESESDSDEIQIVIDQRELDASIARELSSREGITTQLETLAVGDYILSDRVAVERKAVDDFLSTLVEGDRSLFEQVGDAARNYARPVLIIEGEGLYERRNVHPNAIRGALASLAVDFGASILQSRDESDTADLIEIIATREQDDDDREISVHGEKSTKTLAEQQEYVVSAIAEIGPVTARTLLEQFGTVEAVMSASFDELTEVHGVGEVTANRIRELLESEYD